MSTNRGRTANRCGRSSSTARFPAAKSGRRELESSKSGETPVYRPAGVSTESYREYRVSVGRIPSRAIDEITPEDLANAVCGILADFGSCERDTLYRETFRFFGLSTTGFRRS